MLSVAQFGTFEVENYGDLLFPIIFEKELTTRLPHFTLQLYSPLPLPQNQRIKPIFADHKSSCFSSNSALRALVIGGGDIISFFHEITSYYQKNWHYRINPHTACWAIPTIRNTAEIPIIWNAPGIPYEFTEDQSFLMRLLADATDYLSVRDEISLSYLRRAGVNRPIALVPDTALLLPNHLPAKELRPLAAKVFESLGMAIGEPIVFQIHPHRTIIKESVSDMARLLKQLSLQLNRPVLLLPIGYCHDDFKILQQLKIASKGSFQIVTEKLDILSIAAVIAHAGCFIGTSLHGNITAFAYQVPHIIYNAANFTKLKGFSLLIQEPDRCLSDFRDLLSRQSFLKQRPSIEVMKTLTQQLTKHFDHISHLILNPSSCSHKKRNDLSLLENHIEILHAMESSKQQLEAIYQSKTWQLALFLKKFGTRFPLNLFRNLLFKRIFS